MPLKRLFVLWHSLIRSLYFIQVYILIPLIHSAPFSRFSHILLYTNFFLMYITTRNVFLIPDVGSEEKAGQTFLLRGKEPLGTETHRTISKNSSGCRLLIGHKKCFVLLCPIGEHISMSSFRVFVHDGYCLDHGLSSLCTKEIHAVKKLSVCIKSASVPTRLLCQMQANSPEPYPSSWREWILLLLVCVLHKTWN